jgi:uncharacterized membrane protein
MSFLILILSFFGFIDSLYLVFIHYNEGLCFLDKSGCEIVNTSIYSEIFGIPVALLGVLAYLFIFVVSVYEIKSSKKWEPRLILFSFSLFSLFFSLYLTYLEIFVLKAICPFCIISAIIITLIFILSILKLKEYFRLT